MAEEEEVKLIGVKQSPYSCRVEMALKLKGIKYQFIQEDLSNKSEVLLKYNPIHKKIPVLVHNGKPIAESALIVEYIDEAFQGPSILPKDPYERAMARFWSKFIDDKFFLAMRNSYWGNEEEKEKAKKELPEMLKLLEEQLEGKKFFGGESIGLVDIVACFIGHWLGVFEEVMETKLVTKEMYPKLSEWQGEFVCVGAVKECLPPRDELVQTYRARFGKA